MSNREAFAQGDFVVYPSHGVGQLGSIETQTIAGCELKVLVITFEKTKMTLRLPLQKAQASGLRRLTSKEQLGEILGSLKRRVKAKKGVWARRAQEYELKINSGNPTSLAEVLRELYRKDTQPEQSYSERQIYRSALERLSCEVALVESIDEEAATKRVEDILEKAA
tara:strand:+ start:1757 stop:2257 length:501 start_codon:yes stop_codon:yes gene_type:complete